MKTTRSLTIVMVVLTGLGLARTAAAADEPDPGSIHLHGFTFGGNGCSADAGPRMSLDGSVIKLEFDKLLARGGGGGDEAHKDCTLLVDLAYPAGWSFSLRSAGVQGYAHLEAGVRGTQRTQYWFFGEMPKFETMLTGPFDGEYSRKDEGTAEGGAWSRCGAIEPLHIRFSVDIDPPTAAGSTMALRTVYDYGVAWRRCP